MSKNRLGLVIGSLLAICHALWSLAVALIPAQLQNFLEWVMRLHHIAMPFTITAFHLSNAITLVILVFIEGYILGWVLAWLLKVLGKHHKK